MGIAIKVNPEVVKALKDIAKMPCPDCENIAYEDLEARVFSKMLPIKTLKEIKEIGNA